MNRLFAPGCALMLYKPHLAHRLHAALTAQVGPMPMLHACCRHTPTLPEGTEVINVCPGCDRRYRENYEDASTKSAWEVLAESPSLSWPDYDAREMTILDACPTRSETRVHDAIRTLVERMNITLVEPAHTRTQSTCCGDSLWGEASTEIVVSRMKKKASNMPVEEIIVYCVSCSEAMFLGGKRPRYLVDLLFAEATVRHTGSPDQWHAELDRYINSHT